MPSPFPGMNPYLERAAVWPMFHSQFISTCQQRLSRQVRPKYVVRLEARVYIHEPSAAERFAGEPDLGITRPDALPSPNRSSAAVVPAPAPAYGTLPAWVEIEKSRYLEIRDRSSDRVVTVIELLSPTNKYAGPDRDQYIAKRSQVLVSQAHLVEIDLLRGGPRMPVEGLHQSHYLALVSRVGERPRVGMWNWNLRDPQPVLPIPLSEGDADASLNMKTILDEVYDDGSYADFVYSGPPEPRLSPGDAAWAAECLSRVTA
jgi:hypothetical protein